MIKEKNGILEFSIGDNGKGFDTLTVKRGNGLDNMQRRADEMGAKLFLESKKDEGARLSLQMKIT
jgi:signal transduction histidine kinase